MNLLEGALFVCKSASESMNPPSPQLSLAFYALALVASSVRCFDIFEQILCLGVLCQRRQGERLADFNDLTFQNSGP